MTETSSTEVAYRDGKRIRHPKGYGYGDLVPDEDIRRHLNEHVEAGKVEEAAFCAAVLALRQSERSA